MSLLGACLKSRRLRWLAVFFTAGMIALAIADYCFETRGLPEFVRRKIEQRVERYGFRLSMKSCRAGLWNGIVGTGVQMTGGKGQPEFAASRVQIEFLPFRIFQGVFLPFAIRIEEGTAAFPLFPESGAEGIHDRLVISGVNASLSGAPGIIEVTRADGMLNGIRFTMHGTVDNLLHYSGAKWVDELRESLESGSEEPENQPEAESGVPETVSVPESAYDSFIRSVPLALRRKVLYTLQRVYAKQFRQEPSCDVQFHLDITDFAKSTAKASFDIPAFRYGGLQIESIREETSLKDGIIRLDQVRIDLGSGNFIIADGTYDGTGNAATGQVRGRCRIADLILFLDASLQEEIGAMVDIRNEIVTFEGSLEDFKLSSRNYYGKLHVRLPHLNIHRLQLDDVSLSVAVKGRVWEGSLLNASLRNGPVGWNCEFRRPAPHSVAGDFHADPGKRPVEVPRQPERHFVSGETRFSAAPDSGPFRRVPGPADRPAGQECGIEFTYVNREFHDLIHPGAGYGGASARRFPRDGSALLRTGGTVYFRKRGLLRFAGIYDRGSRKIAQGFRDESDA